MTGPDTPRHRYDPYAPRPAAPPAEPAPAGSNPGPDLGGLRKAELVALAQQRGVDTDGTRAELIARLTD